MRSPSPTPARPRLRALGWVGLGLVGVSLIAGVVLATAPRWAAPLVHEAIVDKLTARLDEPVAIDRVTLHWGSIELHGLSIGADDPTIAIDHIDVDLDEGPMWSGKVVVEGVQVTGGRIEGSRAGLQRFAERLRSRRSTGEPSTETSDEARVRIVPDQAKIDELSLAITDGPRAIEAVLAVDARPNAKTAEIRLARVRADLGRGPEVHAAQLRTELRAVRDDDGRLDLEFPVRVEVEGVGAPITPRVAVAGVQGWVELADRDLSAVELELSGGFSDNSDDVEGQKLWSVAGAVRRDLSQGVLRMRMERFELGKVPQVLEGLPLVDSEHATVGGSIAAVFGEGVARVEGDVSLEGINVDHRTLARTTVRDIGFGLQFAVAIDPRARSLDIARMALRRRDVEVRLRGEVHHPQKREDRRYRVRLTVPELPCQSVLDAIPAELVPSLQGFELGGQFSADVATEVDFSDLEALTLDGEIAIANCRVEHTPPHAGVERLAGGFTHRVVMRDGQERVVQMYPGSGSFTPLEQISPYLVAAVLTTEDGGFWGHRGFLPSQFEVALRRNLAAGKIELGASTITMQMVKNVLLSHERTLSRKLQEMFLTWYVEVVLSKSRIMELYLNAIEFGPGIYGVTLAAQHYFGKHPSQLTLPEAVYLALMLPSPVRRHESYCRGELTGSMQVKLQRILGIMLERGKISALDWEFGQQLPIVFDPSDRMSESACMAEIDRLLGGTETQRARNGLLGDQGPPLDDPAPPAPAAWEWSGDPPSEPSDRPPSEADAPGRPAMDDAIEASHGPDRVDRANVTGPGGGGG